MLKSDLIWGCVKYCFQFVRPEKKSRKQKKNLSLNSSSFHAWYLIFLVIQFEISASQNMIDIPVEKASYLNQELF